MDCINTVIHCLLQGRRIFHKIVYVGDLKLPFDDTLNKTKRGRDSDAYYRSHHEISIVIGHSLGGAVALSLEKQYKEQGNNPYGIIQSKTFGAPVVSGSSGNRLGDYGKSIVKDSIRSVSIISIEFLT